MQRRKPLRGKKKIKLKRKSALAAVRTVIDARFVTAVRYACNNHEGERKMYRIMFVCLGNICRSPMAELLFLDMVKKAGREDEFVIASSATAHDNVWNGVGAPVYPQIRALLESKGVDCAKKRAQVLTREHGDEYDLFLCMDDSNVRNAKRILGEKNAHKCKKLLSYAGESGDVADPWYTRDFQTSYDDVERGLKGLLATLR